MDLNDSDSSSKREQFKFSFSELLKYFGPGLLVSIAYLDPGNLAGDMDAGLVGKYSLLWVLLLSTTLGYFFQVKSMMLGLISGKDLAKLCRAHLPARESMLLWVMAEIAIMGSDIQEVLGTAIGLKILFGLELWIGVLLTIFTTFLILIVKHCGERKLEIIFALLIGTMAISFFVNLGYIQPDAVEISSGFLPYIPSYAITATVGLIGSVLMPHNLYLHSAIISEKEENITSQTSLSKSMFYHKIETALSLFISFIINAAVICTFAFYSDRQDDIKLSNAGDVLAGSFGNTAKYIWGIGLLASGQSSTLTGTLAGQYVMSGFLNLKMSNFHRALFTRTIAIIPSIMIAFINDKEDFNAYLNLLQAIQLPFAIIPLLKFSNSSAIMGEDQIGRKELFMLSFLSASIVIANYYSLIPSNIDFTSFSTYFVGILFICYFTFLAAVLCVKIKNILPIEQLSEICNIPYEETKEDSDDQKSSNENRIDVENIISQENKKSA